LRDVLLEDVGLDRAGELLRRDAALARRGEVERHDDRGGAVDRQRHADLTEVDSCVPVEHVVDRVDRDALAADLAEAERRVRVVTHERRHVERGREAGLSVLEQIAEAGVGLDRGAEPGELAHRPQAAAVHRWVDAPRERERPGEADLRVRGQVRRRVQRTDLLTRERGERHVCALRGGGVCLLPPGERVLRRNDGRRRKRSHCARCHAITTRWISFVPS
jgi:hypothetical protein